MDCPSCHGTGQHPVPLERVLTNPTPDPDTHRIIAAWFTGYTGNAKVGTTLATTLIGVLHDNGRSITTHHDDYNRPLSFDEDDQPDDDTCEQCDAPLDDGEGWDGLCGTCADIATLGENDK